MKIFAFAVLALTCAASVQAASKNTEAAAQRVCVDQARAARYHSPTVRSTQKHRKDNFTVTLQVKGQKRFLICDYNGRSGGAQLHW